MQMLLASNGIWVEPASAAGVAGLAHELQAGSLDLKGKRVAAVCTGHGLKDPDIITRAMAKPQVLPAELHALEDYLAEES
jgi:threonine synthase